MRTTRLERGILVLLPIALAASPLAAQDLLLAEAGRWTHGPCFGAAIADDTLAYVSNGQVLEALDLRNGALLGRWPLTDAIDGLACSGDRVAALLDGNRIEILDAGERLDPQVLASLDVGGPWPAMALGEGLLATSRQDTLRIYGIAGLVPHLRSTTVQPGTVQALALQGDRLVLLRSPDELAILDVTDPSAPVELGLLPGCDVYGALALDGDLAVVGDDNSTGARIVDLSDPLAPLALGICETAYSPASAALEGTRLLVSDHLSLSAFNLLDPGAPALLDSTAVAGACQALAMRGGRIVGALGPRASVWTWQAGALSAVAERQTGYFAMGLALRGQTGYLALNRGGLAVLDLSNPANPVEIGPRRGGFNAYALARWQDRLALAVLGEGLRVYDLADPSNPLETGRAATAPSGSIAADRGLAWLTTSNQSPDTLLAYDLSGPGDPSRISATALPWSYVAALAVEGDLLALAAYSQGLQFYDVSDPGTPQWLGEWTPEGRYISGVALQEGVAAVLDGTEWGLLDVSDPAAPQPLHYEALDPADPRPTSVLLAGQHVLIGTWEGLEVWWIGDPAQPLQSATFPVPGGVSRLAGRAGTVAGLGGTGLTIWSSQQVDLDLTIDYAEQPAPHVELSWNPVSFASRYRVESSGHPWNGPWSDRGTTTSTAWSDVVPSGSSGQVYRVVVEAD